MHILTFSDLRVFSFSFSFFSRTDSQCEDAILTALFGLIEGRPSKDDAYDTVAQAVFPDVVGGKSNDIIVHNLKNVSWKQDFV